MKKNITRSIKSNLCTEEVLQTRSQRVIEKEELGCGEVTCCRDQRKAVSQGQPVIKDTTQAASTQKLTNKKTKSKTKT